MNINGIGPNKLAFGTYQVDLNSEKQSDKKMFADLAGLPKQKFENIPLYRALEEIYGLPTIHNEELISAVAAKSDIAKMLKIKNGSPVMLMEMLSFTYKQTPYEYRKSYCLTDKKAIFREI